MNHRRALCAVLAAALATVTLAGCASHAANSGGSPTSPTPSLVTPRSTTTTPTTASSARGASGGRTMSPPHIVCHQGAFTVRYDGTQVHPVELCIQSGATGHIMISEPAGATWRLPIASPARVVAARATRSGRTLDVRVTAGQHGSAMLAVPGTAWQLEIAVP